MRLQAFAIGFALLSSISGAGTATAGHACVTVKETLPIVGTTTRTQCSPVGTPFTHPFEFKNCGGTPPIGEAHCITINLHTP